MRSPRMLFLLMPLVALGCNPAVQKKEEPVKSEADLAFTHISKDAYKALNIQVQPVAKKQVIGRLTLTGWIMAKPGCEVTLTAPAAGYVHFADSQAPMAGLTVTKNHELLQIKPVLSPVEKIQVDALERTTRADFVNAQTTLINAKIELKRTEDLFKVNARNKEDLLKAEQAVAIAQELLDSAKERTTFFKVKNIALSAPRDGTISVLHVSDGQYVPAATPLFTIVDLNPIWIRVPVPEHDLPAIDPQPKDGDPQAIVDVEWKNSGGKDAGKPAFAKAIYKGRVPQVDPLKHTADFWYELKPTEDSTRLVKDQMVTVMVPTSQKTEGFVIPYSAIAHDAHGHAWIYVERTKESDKRHEFERRPVELVSSNGTGDDVVIRAHLADGDRVVVRGALLLFSRDFHKTPVPGEAK